MNKLCSLRTYMCLGVLLSQVLISQIPTVESFSWHSLHKPHVVVAPETHTISQRLYKTVPTWYPYNLWRRKRKPNAKHFHIGDSEAPYRVDKTRSDQLSTYELSKYGNTANKIEQGNYQNDMLAHGPHWVALSRFRNFLANTGFGFGFDPRFLLFPNSGILTDLNKMKERISGKIANDNVHDTQNQKEESMESFRNRRMTMQKFAHFGSLTQNENLLRTLKPSDSNSFWESGSKEITYKPYSKEDHQNTISGKVLAALKDEDSKTVHGLRESAADDKKTDWSNLEGFGTVENSDVSDTGKATETGLPETKHEATKSDPNFLESAFDHINADGSDFAGFGSFENTDGFDTESSAGKAAPADNTMDNLSPVAGYNPSDASGGWDKGVDGGHVPKGRSLDSGSWTESEGFAFSSPSETGFTSSGSWDTSVGHQSGSASGFFEGGFSDATGGCDGIEARNCNTDDHCSCYGMYQCSSGRCAPISNPVPSAGTESAHPGFWHEEPVVFTPSKRSNPVFQIFMLPRRQRK